MEQKIAKARKEEEDAAVGFVVIEIAGLGFDVRRDMPRARFTFFAEQMPWRKVTVGADPFRQKGSTEKARHGLSKTEP